MKTTVRSFCFSTAFLALLATTASGQALNYFEVQSDGAGGVDGLDGTYGVAVSSDDLHVYTASTSDDAVAVFEQTGGGGLTFVDSYFDDGNGGSIDGLRDAKRLKVSPDGKSVYVPTTGDDALVVFSRNSTTGELTYVETHKDGASGVDGLNGAYELAISPDNKHVYVAASSDDAVAVFSRNTTTGELTYVEVQVDGSGGIDGLNGARSVVVSPDGSHVYVASSIDDAVAIFSRNTTTGELTFVTHLEDGVGGVDGLNGAYGVSISPDGDHVYAVSSSDDAVVVFSRNSGTGELTFDEVHIDDSRGGSVQNLNAGRAIAVSFDGTLVFAASSSDDGMVVFDRNGATGALTINEEHKDGVSGVDGLDGARMIATTSDDVGVYAVSSSDDAIAVFENVTVLPIELLDFTARVVEKAVELHWSTAAEVNNDYFTVERSVNGLDYEPIAEIQGAGNSNEKNDYLTIDDRPNKALNYYRLKQTDFDGAFEYSDVVAVELAHDAVGPERQIEVYPNPATDGQDVYLQLRGFSQQEVLVVVQDVFGRPLYSKVLVTGAFGEESVFAVDPNNNLSPGTYIITGSADDNLFSKKLIVK